MKKRQSISHLKNKLKRLTEEQEQALLSSIKTDNVYHKYYDDVLMLLKTGLRISELCGLTIMDLDFIHEVVIMDHQLLKSKEQGYYIETPKTKSGTRQVPQGQSFSTYYTAYAAPYVLHKAGRQEHEPKIDLDM